MSEIADFLRARYAERRIIAEAAAALQGDPENGWGITDHSNYDPAEKRRWIAPHIGMLHEVESAEHVVANNPAVVIADLDAKLAIVELADKTRAWTEGSAGATAGYASAIVDDILRILAQPFAGHLDHKGEEWTP